MIQIIVENIKTIGACITGITACATGYVYLDGPIPASTRYVANETQTIKRDVIEGRLQLNTVQKNLLRKEKFDRELDLQKVNDPQFRSILQQRHDQIGDELDNIEKEREKLLEEKRK